MGAAMVLMSLFCLVLGIWPGWFYALLPYPVDYQAYTAGNVLFYLQLLLFSGLAFFLLLPLMKRTTTITLDWDWLWRAWLFRRWRGLNAAWTANLARLRRATTSRLYPALGRAAAYWHSGGVFSRSWTIGTTALWIVVLLSAYVFIYYL
jgi:multicomponent Na+:H+ antiporter subunit D